MTIWVYMRRLEVGGNERTTGVRSCRPWDIWDYVKLAKLEQGFPESPSHYGLGSRWPQANFSWEHEGTSEQHLPCLSKGQTLWQLKHILGNLLAHCRHKATAPPRALQFLISFLPSAQRMCVYLCDKGASFCKMLKTWSSERLTQVPQSILVGCSLSLLSPTFHLSFLSDCLLC